MIRRLTDFINARLQRGLKRVAGGERSFHKLHLVEAKC